MLKELLRRNKIKSRIRDLKTKLDLFDAGSDRSSKSVLLAKKYAMELETLYAELKK